MLITSRIFSSRGADILPTNIFIEQDMPSICISSQQKIYAEKLQNIRPRPSLQQQQQQRTVPNRTGAAVPPSA
jgi:hypothetical protein